MLLEVLTSLIALVFVVGLILGLAHIMRRFKLGPVAERVGADRSMRVLESKMLDSKHHLLVVEWRGTEYLLMSAGQSITSIDQKPVEEKTSPAGFTTQDQNPSND